MENRKTSIIIYPADFLASVHNFKKSEIANLIVAICEFNLFGATSVKLSELNKKRFDAIQQVIANHNEKWRQTCEINAQNAKRAVSRRKANAKRTVSEVIEFPSTGRQQEKESENEKESDKDNDKDCREREMAFVDNLSYIGAPTAEDVSGYCNEIGITIDIPAFISWHNERGWKHGKKCIARDWQKAIRQWYCKDNELSLHEFEVTVLKREYAKELSKGGAL